MSTDFEVNQKHERILDLLTIISFQKEAVEIWDKIVQCTPFGSDPRKIYANSNYACRSRQATQSLENQIQYFKSNIRNFLTTHDISNYKNEIGSFQQFCVADVCLSTINRTIESDAIKNLFHPLFGQIIFETLVKETEIYNVDGTRNLEYGNPILFSNSSLILGMLASFNCFSYNLWPAASRPILEIMMYGPRYRNDLNDYYNKIAISCGDVTNRSFTFTQNSFGYARTVSIPGIYNIGKYTLHSLPYRYINGSLTEQKRGRRAIRSELRKFVNFIRDIK